MISKKYFTGQGYQERRKELYNWLKENAEGHVFDTVEDSADYIECYKKGKKMVRFMSLASVSNIFTLRLENGVEMAANLGGATDDGYMIKTNTGIFIIFWRGSYPYYLFVTKDGAMAGLWSTSSNPANASLYSAFFQDRVFIDYGTNPGFSASMTSFAPLCGNGDFSTSTNIYCTPHSSYRGERCILFDGEHRYVYSGFFAMKE